MLLMKSIHTWMYETTSQLPKFESTLMGLSRPMLKSTQGGILRVPCWGFGGILNAPRSEFSTTSRRTRSGRPSQGVPVHCRRMQGLVVWSTPSLLRRGFWPLALWLGAAGLLPLGLLGMGSSSIGLLTVENVECCSSYLLKVGDVDVPLLPIILLRGLKVRRSRCFGRGRGRGLGASFGRGRIVHFCFLCCLVRRLLALCSSNGAVVGGLRVVECDWQHRERKSLRLKD